MALTEKQRAFCRNIVSGMNNKDAYISAYNSNSPNAAWIESTKLLNRDDIQAEIKTLRKPIELDIQNKAMSARQKQIDFINERIVACLEKEDEQSIIRYTDMLNKINALYKETEQEKAPENNVATLDIETLRKLSS